MQRHGQIDADPDLFERAVGNLLENALRFIPEHGSIGAPVSKHNSDFEVAVHDNGSGIAAEHLPHVFDRFYRADSSRSSDGAGLGFALVKSIVDLHGGSAIIASNPGSRHNGQAEILAPAGVGVIAAGRLSAAGQMTKK